MELFELLSQKAESHGIPIHGSLDIDSVLESEFPAHVQRFDSWLSSGRDGEMAYLKRGRDRRADPRLVLPEARSIFCVAVPYWRQPVGEEGKGPRYARYLRGHDYHDWVAEKLEAVMKDVAAAAEPGLQWKVCVDTSAILERSWASLAGLGWIGKNTTLIHPKYGSYLFLGEVLLNRKVSRGPNPIPNYCGNCTRCLSACPTGAFSAPGELDSRNCISYWTLEKRGELGISEEQKRKTGTWVAGCDICQEVCPFNLKPAREVQADPPGSDATKLEEWFDLLGESPEAFRKRIGSSALNRVKPAQFSRNLAVALGNQLASGKSAMNKEALERFQQAILRRIEVEHDPVALGEWQQTLKMLS